MVRVFRRKKSRSKRKPKVKATTRRPEAILEGSVRGEVRYPWGPVAHATIVAGDRSAVAEATGKYEISALRAGIHVVSVTAPFPGYEAASQNVTVAAGETKAVDFFLDFKKTVVRGHVYDSEGKPIAGATLSGVLCSKDVETTTTDDEGHFRFDRARPGNQFIRVNALGYMGETRDFTAKENEATIIDFRLTAATCEIQGTVTDSAGKSLKAEVHLSKSGIIVQKIWSIGETGHYEFFVLPGVYDLLANAAGYISNGWRGEVGTDTKVDFKLATLPDVKLKK